MSQPPSSTPSPLVNSGSFNNNLAGTATQGTPVNYSVNVNPNVAGVTTNPSSTPSPAPATNLSGSGDLSKDIPISAIIQKSLGG